MGLKEILTNPELHAIFAETLSSQELPDGVADICSRLASKLGSPEFILPILGVQGAGKSTLLNSLCFDSPVLPIGADETTAVPVEIRRREDTDGSALAIFKDGRREQVGRDQESLGRYVDQVHNPGNSLGLERLSVVSDAPFLAGGLVLVDLPGLGSLTQENHDTTVEYITNASGIICIVRTTPPLTETEAEEIKLHWNFKRGNTYFVQNVWADEGPEEIEEGRAYNQELVDRFARELKIAGADSQGGGDEGSSPFRVMPVNAWRALRDRCSGGSESGGGGDAEEIAAFLLKLGARWKVETAEQARRELLGFISAALAALEARSEALGADRDSARKMIEESHDSMLDKIRLFEKLHSEAAREIRSLKGELSSACSRWKSDEGEYLRTRMRELAYGGITDGERLNLAFGDCTRDSLARLGAQVQGRVSDFEDRMLNKLSAVAARNSGPAVTGKVGLSGLEEVSLSGPVGSILGEDGRRMRDLLPTAGLAVGGLAVLALTPLVPILTIAGSLVLPVLGSFVGGKVRMRLAQTHVDQVVSQVPEMVDEFLEDAVKSLNHSVARYHDGFEGWFGDQQRFMKRRAEADYEACLVDTRKSEAERESDRARLEETAASLLRFRAEAETAAA
ncbi:MAG: dynamin family protein [Deltaproteobacteria bacterium]|jgi:hypothetical protein|nr:dynamin family protein [Deltaproteobacteria bacterium]